MTASSAPSSLTSLQADLLREFFAREQSFFLTGGAALAGFYFGHRKTEDLDLFALPGVNLDNTSSVLLEVASACGAALTSMERSPDFRRFLVKRSDESCVIDLVVDRAPSIVPEKRRIGSIRVDPLREIAANKICTLLGRTEAKDLLDIQALIEAGIDLRQAVNDAQQKDGGTSAATLAFLMEDHRAWNAAVPAGELAGALAALRSDLARQFRAIAFEQARK